MTFCVCAWKNGELHIARKLKWTAVLVFGFLALWIFSFFNEATFKLLVGMSSPFIPPLIYLLIPALLLRKSRFYRIFLFLPVLIIAIAVVFVLGSYQGQSIFAWFPMSPELFIPVIISVFLVVEPLLSLNAFRYFVRIGSFIVLIYGGFMFRKDFNDYKDMLSRRKIYNSGMMTLTETLPVMSVKDDANYSYLPSAPCRFSPDGGYVQGCNMEMFQRLMQLDFAKVRDGDLVEMRLASKIFGAVVFFLVFSMICARWFCGWICPLSTAGDVLDRIRRFLNLPHMKPSQPIKLAYFFSGAGLASFGLFLAKLYPRIDENGKFMGCKIPVFPFCKICPAQQICPTFAGGPENYPSVPGWEWVFGFYRLFTVSMLIFFIASFAVGRRMWCYFCPMGMISGIFNRGGMLTLRKNTKKCNSCGVCYEVCPMHIDSVRAEMKNSDVSSFDCVLCLKCVEKCPQDKCLSFEFAGKKLTESKFD
ncbi:MAG TPA: 4Fe-4S binding protein [Victivallales bacterium]|nr:4Fe-4S binding protein [Victivallales bacterium]